MKPSDIPKGLWDESFRKSPPGTLIINIFEVFDMFIGMGKFWIGLPNPARKELGFQIGVSLVILTLAIIFLIVWLIS